MSINRRCSNCFQKENIRFNFGHNRDAEIEFHSQKWCNCGYDSPNEMMADQDMGFTDPNWIPISKYFIQNYHLRIRQGNIQTSEELVRFFLKLLKSSANNIRKSIEIVNLKENEKYTSICDGRSDRESKINIFESTLYSNIGQGIVKVEKKSKAYIILSIGIIVGMIIGKLI